MSTKNLVSKMSTEEQQLFVKYVFDRLNKFPRDRYVKRLKTLHAAIQFNIAEEIAGEMQKDIYDGTDRQEIKIKAQELSSLGPATTGSIAESIQSFLHNVFLTDRPLFRPISGQEGSVPALQVLAILKDQERKSQFGANLEANLADLANFDCTASLIRWVRKTTSTIKNNIRSETGEASEVEKSIWEGNEIKRIPVENLLFDPSVPVSKVASDGTFSGFVENLNQHLVAQLLREVEFEQLDSKVRNDILSAPYGSGSFDIEYLAESESDSAYDTIEQYLGGKQPKQINSRYHHAQVYLRYYPMLMDFESLSTLTNNPYEHVILRVDILNQKLLNVEVINNAHGMLPLITSSTDAVKLVDQLHSRIDKLLPFQRQIQSLLRKYLRAVDKEIRNNVMYNPAYIDKASLEKHHNDNADIPIKSQKADKESKLNPLQLAVQPLPDTRVQSYTVFEAMMRVADMAREVAGINQVQGGNFVKGNKTKHEFMSVMGNADAKLVRFAANIESTFFNFVKLMVKTNIIQFQTSQVLTGAEGEEISVEPEVLRKFLKDITLAEHTSPVETQAGMDALNLIMQNSQSPLLQEFGMEFNVSQIFSKILSQTTSLNIYEYRRSPEDMQNANRSGSGGANNPEQ